MAYPPDQIETLKKFFPELSSGEEGGTTFIRIENFVLPEGCAPRDVAALLCPGPREGYPSRLYISQKVTHSGKANWNPDGGSLILGQQWWALSWMTQAGKPLLQMVMDHMEGFRA